MASTKDSGLGQLAMFELRFKHICTMHSKGETEAAETKALELLAEPRLGRLHKAGMHMILATSETDFVHHSLEARASLEHWHAEAKKLLEEARSDQSAIDNEINEKLKSGMTMRQIQDAQLSEMYERLARIGEEEGASAETSTAAPSDQDAEV
ncbi:hypothetical protein CGCSCA4_v013523 [Colletotrichum siamense]|uniref:Uncharacterized protein n=1 Tax=Colletotrichum siamense TaxID=690259 RepID=A0A9P5BPR2_COLSI|nr:hypothetical protein CGCSCA4_v013523 [Colletotrichum siamense]KAF4845513.1 hypothetical protein CGCSCA2_v013573 [Colletotrichum siamense]